MRFGIPESDLPVRWLEAGAEGSGTREYWEDVFEYRGDLPDIAVRGHLVITQNPQTDQRTYALSEFQIKTQSGAPSKLIDTITSSGNVSVERFVTEPEPLTVYRLDGATTPERMRVFVRFDDILALPHPQGLEKTTRNTGNSLALIGTATARRIEVSDAVLQLLNQKVKLHVGDELVTRLDRVKSFEPYTLKPASIGTQLQAESSLTGEAAPSREADRAIQVFRFKAIGRGWTDLEFEHGGSGQTFRVKVE
jgi:hypothetical protein